MTDEDTDNLKADNWLGHYRIVSKIGAGGMGEVYLAEDTRLERKVAIKFLNEEFSKDADKLKRFIQEAKATSALNHPNILTVYEIGKADGRNYIATELIEGETLREHLSEKESLQLNTILKIGIQVSEALTAAHQAGIVHRDIKPENIMIRRDGYAKVLDFGLAKLTEKKRLENVLSEDETRAFVQTNPGMVMGTVQYMSPEQARGKETDARTDIWSLGVVLYEMLSGKPPFTGETVNHTIVSILEKEPLLLESVPDELQRIIRKALTKEKEMRYQTARDLLIDLKNLRRSLDIQGEFERSIIPNKAAAEEKATQIYAAAATQEERKAVKTKDAASVSSLEYAVTQAKGHKFAAAIVLTILVGAISAIAYFGFFAKSNATQIQSIAVLPFVNESGNADVEYLSDGMTESLINSLSQLPKLSVKARSSVFRYKGKATEAKQVGADLNVQAVLNGRVTQRGDDLTLYLSLDDVQTGNQIWGRQYNRKITNLVALQAEIARDVSNNLRTKLSGADEQKLAKKYTENAEAYQFYLKGRFHLLKTTRSEFETSISYFQQAIAIDPFYARAYAGLADAYRSLSLAGEMPSTEVMPKAKAAAQRAIELDDTLAEAHANLGSIIFWYDWDWNTAENQFKRALELDSNSADTHLFYANLLSNMGRRAEGLAEAKRARELDPLNRRINGLEGQFLIHAGQTDEALTRLQKTLELDPNYWLAHSYLAGAYIEKGMYSEAVAEARKAREFSGVSTTPISFLGYALAKSGKEAEARAELEELLRLSKENYVSPYNIAMIYNGLDKRDETLAWLERGFVQRDVRMTFLKVEPKWNNLRDDPRFQNLLKKVGFPQ